MTSILTNSAAMTALKVLRQTETALGTTQERISTGLKVNSAKDDASTWAISQGIKSDVQTFTTINNGLTMANSALDTAAKGATGIKEQITVLQQKIAEAQIPGADTASIQDQIDTVLKDIAGKSKSATFNGTNLLTGSDPLKVLSGLARDASGTATAQFMNVNRQDLTMGVGGGLAMLSGLNVASETLTTNDSAGAGQLSVDLGGGAASIAAGAKTSAEAAVALEDPVNDTTAMRQTEAKSILADTAAAAVKAGLSLDDTDDVATILAAAKDALKNAGSQLTSDELDTAMADTTATGYRALATTKVLADAGAAAFGITGETADTVAQAMVKAAVSVGLDPADTADLATIKTATTTALGVATTATTTTLTAANFTTAWGVDGGTAIEQAKFKANVTDAAAAAKANPGPFDAATEAGTLTFSYTSSAGKAKTVELNYAAGATKSDIAKSFITNYGDKLAADGIDVKPKLSATGAPTGELTFTATGTNTKVGQIDGGKGLTHASQNSQIVMDFTAKANPEVGKEFSLNLSSGGKDYGIKIRVVNSVADGGSATGTQLGTDADGNQILALSKEDLANGTGAELAAALKKALTYTPADAATGAAAKGAVMPDTTTAASDDVVGLFANPDAVDPADGSPAPSTGPFSVSADANGELIIKSAVSTDGTVPDSIGRMSNPTVDFSQLQAVVDAAAKVATSAAQAFGTAQSQAASQQDFLSNLVDSLNTGVGALIDADITAESARLNALQTQQQLATQSLSIANQSSQNVLSLFR